MRLSRDNRGILANWWFTVDKVLAVAILVLIATGVVLSLAASPPVAIKRGLGAYYYVERQALFAVLAVVIMLSVSLLSPLGVRRLALAAGVALFLMLVAVLFLGREVNGAIRWIYLAGHSLQPSEFYKPVFAVSLAWLFTLARERHDRTALVLAVALYLTSAALLLAEPDVGQTLLLSLIWGALFVLAGYALKWAMGLAGLGLIGLAAAYVSFAHVQSRIDRFINPGAGDSYQTDRALQSFIEGGFFGRGPGEGTIKSVLPDAHTDFIFAVIAEEYGILACLVLLGLYAFIVLRALTRVWDEPDSFVRNAVIGLSLLFCLQGVINMAVNVGLLPAKGMTLPFISAGGSSTLAMGLTMGMILALTRWRPERANLKKPTFLSTPDLSQSAINDYMMPDGAAMGVPAAASAGMPAALSAAAAAANPSAGSAAAGGDMPELAQTTGPVNQ